jgi:cGMP-specific 3',5'-cyclic phosphodiesterase, invertebrate
MFCQTFAIFCGLGVHNCQLHEKVDKLTARHRVTCDVLAFHATASAQETASLAVRSLHSLAYILLKSYIICLYVCMI